MPKNTNVIDATSLTLEQYLEATEAKFGTKVGAAVGALLAAIAEDAAIPSSNISDDGDDVVVAEAATVNPWDNLDNDDLKALAAKLELADTKPKAIKVALASVKAKKLAAAMAELELTPAVAGETENNDADGENLFGEDKGKADKAAAKAAKSGKGGKGAKVLDLSLSAASAENIAARTTAWEGYSDADGVTELERVFGVTGVKAKGAMQKAIQAEALAADLESEDFDALIAAAVANGVATGADDKAVFGTSKTPASKIKKLVPLLVAVAFA